MNKRQQRKLSGYVVSNLVALVTIGATKYLLPQHDRTVLISSEFVLVPLSMGIISGWIWQELRLGGTKLTYYSCLNSLLAIALSFIFLKEGAICLLIVSPLIFCFVIAGAFIGRSIYKKNNKTLNVSMASLLLFVFAADALSKHEYINEVSDSILVNAPPEKVWKNVVAFKRIKKENTFWLFRIGMPSPVESTVTGYYAGAGRKCIFSNGYAFGERISTYREHEDLTFDIIDQPRDPEIMGHIDVLRGQFLLHDNGNGTTMLTGNSWYKLYVFPVWYYDQWAQSITRNVHLRVMAHIKQLSEK